MGVEPYLVGNSVSAIMAQRLARKLCEKCKTRISPDENYLSKLEFPIDALTKNAIYGPVGCSECSDTGYRGRVSVVEIMAVTEPIERLVVDGAPSSLIRNAAIKDGFVSLKQDGFRRVLQGLTTIEEVMRVTS
jgi:type II secretory ATPase GspE/PulE/Tfp pilus assembly ATPase PilB-like protein